MFGGCHGADRLKTPTLDIKNCPECGAEVELFSIDTSVDCDNCGFTVYNDIQNCVLWCKHAKLCVGEELYNKMMEAHRAEQARRAEEKELAEKQA
ncbi:MAG TPA: hypothetical protein GXZ77_08785 [Papillibacter sp.]|nr:hypothetical protein [Papillibacter sp.]